MALSGSRQAGLKAINKIVLDANMLLNAVDFRIDLAEEINALLQGRKEYFVPGQVVGELGFLAERKRKLRVNAVLAKKWIERHAVEIKVAAENADDALLALAEKGFIVASNDRELKKRIKAVNGKMIVLRGKKKLMLY
ncbi:hypothetical protein HZB89_02400 [archaeon]|nr:hypothetical protein [archaeon]